MHRSSLVARYTLLTLSILFAVLACVALLYERVTESVQDTLVGDRLAAQEAATANRMVAFLEARLYQLATISNYPSLPAFLANPGGLRNGDAAALLRLEADVPDLYGILFFRPSGELGTVVAGQAASGPPYWTGSDWSIDHLPKVSSQGVEVIGPRLPSPGLSGWLMLRRPIRDGAGSVALHVRLASLTELLNEAAIPGVVRMLLRTPSGAVLDGTGRPVADSPAFTPGTTILPGWQVVMDIQSDALLQPLRLASYWFYAAGVALAAAVTLLLAHLSGRLRRRVGDLVIGAHAVASGDLTYRLPVARTQDEISVLARAFNTMAARLQDMIDRIVRAEKMAVLGEFATGVAHEVRNPLATMKTTVQALGLDEPDPDRRALLEDMENEVDRLNRVVGDLLTYGRPAPVSRRAVPVREVFRRAVSLLRPLAAERGVTVSTGGDSRLVLHADPDQVLQVLVNLGLNAVQACGRDGGVTFRAQPDAAAGLVVIEVNDDGAGIPPELHKTVFTPFFTTRPDGTGLGLAICLQMVEANHGRLTLRSKPGEGTTITLALPAATTGNDHD